MAITYLSGQRVQGIAGSGLGSSADGTNTGITLEDSGGVFGKYYSFSDSDGLVATSTASDWDFLHNTTAKFTISCWFKRPTSFATADVGVLFATTVGTGAGIEFSYRDGSYGTDRLNFEMVDSSDGQVIVTALDNYFPDNSDWHHFCGTYDASLGSNNYTAYLDGVLKTEATKSGTPTDGSPASALKIGSGVSTHDWYSNWKLDDIGIWNTVLPIGTDEDTADSVKWLYNTGTGRLANTIPTGLKAYYNLDSVPATNDAVSDKSTLVVAGNTGIYGGDSSEYVETQGDGGGSGSAGFSIATGQGGLAGNSAVINSANRDWNNSFNFVTHGGVSAIDSTTSFVMEFDMFRASDDGSADQVADHPCFYLDTTGTGADPNVGADGAWITFGWVNNDSNMFRIYCKDSGGTAYEANYTSDEFDIQSRNTTKYYRATFNETGFTDKVRLYMYPTAVARTNDTYGSGTYAGTGATFVGTSAVFTGGATGKQAWADADAFTNFTMVTYNSLQKHFATKNVKFWNDTVDNTGTPELNLTIDAKPASSNLPNGTQFEQTDDYKTFQLNDGVWTQRGTAI
jgi:hypothetical protein